MKGVTYLPMQDRWISGFIKEFEVHTSLDGKNWRMVCSGEFGNIENSPIRQIVQFESVRARFIKLQAGKTTDGNPPSFADVDVITVQQD